jgi:hypothetical protein
VRLVCPLSAISDIARLVEIKEAATHEASSLVIVLRNRQKKSAIGRSYTVQGNSGTIFRNPYAYPPGSAKRVRDAV